MANFNNVTLLGNLVADPELKEISDANPVSKFRLAVNRKFTTKSGDKKSDTLYIDCEMWGKRAEALQKYTKKGDPLLVNGFLKQDTWETKDGEYRSKILVSVQDFEFISTKGSSSSDESAGASPAKSEPQLEDVPF